MKSEKKKKPRFENRQVRLFAENGKLVVAVDIEDELGHQLAASIGSETVRDEGLVGTSIAGITVYQRLSQPLLHAREGDEREWVFTRKGRLDAEGGKRKDKGKKRGYGKQIPMIG